MRTFIRAVLAASLASAAGAAPSSVWLPSWDDAALTSLQSNPDAVGEVNPVWYTLDSTGEIVKNWNAENPDWRASMAGYEVLPTIQNYTDSGFDGELVHELLADPVRRSRHVEDLVYLVVSGAFAGVDIDYESLGVETRAFFSTFVEELADALHSESRLLSVTVSPKTSADQRWRGPGGQDWGRIAAAADRVKIMGYDFHWSTSGPGPIAPLSWLEEVARYAASVIPRSKLQFALPWYGYDWSAGQGRGVDWDEATMLARREESTVVRDRNGELTYRYGDHTVFFQDAESFRRKVATVAPFASGISVWKPGGEDPESWNVLKPNREPGGGAASPVVELALEGLRRLRLDADTPGAVFWTVGASDPGITVKVSMEAVTLPGARLDRDVARDGDRVQLLLHEPAPGTHEVVIQLSAGEAMQVVPVTLEVVEPPLRLEITGTGSARVTAGSAETVAVDTLWSRPPDKVVVKAGIVGDSSGLTLAVSTNRSGTKVVVGSAVWTQPGTRRLEIRWQAEGSEWKRSIELTVQPPARRRGARR